MDQMKAMKQALEALERGETKLRFEAITTLRQAIQEQAQPVAYRCWNKPKNADGTFGVVRTWISGKPEGDGNEPLYTAAPPPRQKY